MRIRGPSLLIIPPVLLLYCTAPVQLTRTLDYKNIDLSYDRSLCGRSPLPFWFSLTQAEIDVLQNIEKAKAGDPEVLLSLGLIASGDVREAEDFRRYHTRVSRFVDAVRPEIRNEPDFLQKGNVLFRRMREAFFVSDTSSELAGYEFGQSRLSVIFEKGTYNCISSSILFCILGRWFDMQVDGVITRGHAFVQITAPGGGKVELETTSRNGYNWVHNEEFYRNQSSKWFRMRGISRQTYEDYTLRRIVEPYRLICHNMKNQHTHFSRMDVEDVHRLIECRAYIDDANTQFQTDLISTYRIELSDLEKNHAASTIRRFYRTIAPRSALILDRCGHDSVVAAAAGQLYKQLLTVSERGIDTLLARDTCPDADSVYGLFTVVAENTFRLFPDDTAMHDITTKMSMSLINRLSNRISDLIEKERVGPAASHYAGAEPFVGEQVRLFPDEKGILMQSGYFEEKKQLLLFAGKKFDDFIAFTRGYIEKVGKDTGESDVLFRNALYNTFMYIKYCTEQKEFTKAERLIDVVSAFAATDMQFAQNLQWALGEAFHFHFDNADWPEAMRICRKQIAVDVKGAYKKINSGNLQVCYQNWAAEYYNNGNWPKVREILTNCVNDTGSESGECSSKLRELEKEHSF